MAKLSAVGVHCLQHDLTESFDDVDDDFTGTEARFRYTEEGINVSLIPDTDFMHEVLGS